MRNRIKFVAILLIIVCFVLNTRMTTNAENIQEVATEKLAVTLVIDMSGSMADTDPQKMRETAANIFIDLLSPEDYLGIVAFNTTSVVVQPLQKVSDAANKTAFKAKLAPYITANGYTDYKPALDDAYNQLNGLTDANVRKMVVFITDGEPSLESKNAPAGMTSYTDYLLSTVNTFALNKIPIYSIGFSDNIKTDILKLIALNTSGDFKILYDQASLARSFFETLGNLKHREKLIDTAVELNNDSGIDFYMDEYTSQATLVIVNKNGALSEAELVNPQGQTANQFANIQKTDKYTIITLNNQDSQYYGKWRLKLKGTGTVDVFGNKDMTFKSWVVSPSKESMHALGEPIELEVNVTGESQDAVSVKAYIKGAGQTEVEEVELNNAGKTFSGTYDKTQAQGNYSIRIDVLLNGTVITSTEQTIDVRPIPVLACDFFVNAEGYRAGEKVGITSSLNMKGIKLQAGSSFKVSNYSLLISNEDGTSRNISLEDNGLADNNDIMAGDGVWSGWIDFPSETVSNISLIATGTYNSENFVLEKELGACRILKHGEVNATSELESLTGSAGKTTTLPIYIENKSDFTETLYATVDNATGTIVNDKIVVEPNSQTTVMVDVLVNENVKKGSHPIELGLRAENTLTVVNSSQFPKQMEIISGFTYYIRNVVDYIRHLNDHLSVPVIVCLIIIICMALVFVIGGTVLYKTIGRSRSIISGTLRYYAKDEKVSDITKSVINFEDANKSQVVISFSKENKKADFYINNTVNDYSLIISNEEEETKVKFPFISGWKALLKNNDVIRYQVTATPPGIMEKNGEIFTHKIINDGDTFESGGYYFNYLASKNKYTEMLNAGKNILEGKKDEKSKGL